MKMGKICLAAAIASLAWAAHGIAATTFVTGAVIGPGVTDYLFGFDDETEVFASSGGGTSAFQGAAVLGDVILVADFTTEAVRRFTPGGTLLSNFANFPDASYLEVDRAQNVYVTSGSLGPASATRFNNVGVATGTFVAPELGAFFGIDADAAGNVYAAFNGSTSQILKFASDGSFLGSAPLAVASDIAIDEANGLLYAIGANQIDIYDLSGALPSLSGAVPAPVNVDLYGLHYSSQLGTIFATDIGVLSGDPKGLQLALDGTVLATYRPLGVELVFDITHRVPEPASTLLVIGSVLALGVSHRPLRSRR
jgi:hypothetical protein